MKMLGANQHLVIIKSPHVQETMETVAGMRRDPGLTGLLVLLQRPSYSCKQLYSVTGRDGLRTKGGKVLQAQVREDREDRAPLYVDKKHGVVSPRNAREHMS